MWELHVTGPLVVPQVHRLSPGATWVVGRDAGADLALPSSCVSRRHALVTASDDGLRVADLGSRNGTLLNGRPLGPVSRDVEPGDVIGVGDFLLKVERAAVSPRRSADGFVTLRSGPLDENPFTTRLDTRVPADLRPSEPSYGPLLFHLAETLARGAATEPFLHELLSVARGVTGFEGTVLLGPTVGAFEPLHPGRREWSKTILDATIARRSALLVAHLPEAPMFNAAESVILGGHLHVLCAPFLQGEAVLGALYLTTHVAAPPSQSAVDFVGSLAQLASDVLARSQTPTAVPEFVFPFRRIHDTAAFLGQVISELSRTVVSPDGAPRAVDPRQVEDMKDLLEEASSALQQLSAGVSQLAEAHVPARAA